MDRDAPRETGRRLRDGLVAGLATAMVVACILWNLDAPIRLGFAVLTQQYMAFQLGLALALAYIRFGWRGGDKPGQRRVEGRFADDAIAAGVARSATLDQSEPFELVALMLQRTDRQVQDAGKIGQREALIGTRQHLAEYRRAQSR